VITGQHLGHEKWIAAGNPVQVGGGTPGAARQLPDRILGQWRKRDTPRAVPWQAAKHLEQRVFERDFVVAIGQHEQHRRPIEPPADVTHEIEGRGVRPVQVFEHEQRGLVAQPCEQIREQAAIRLPRMQRPRNAYGQELCQIDQRSERPRCMQRLAACHQHADGCGAAFGKSPDHRGLADARFARNKHDGAAAACCVPQRSFQRSERTFAFQQLHSTRSTHAGADCRSDGRRRAAEFSRVTPKAGRARSAQPRPAFSDVSPDPGSAASLFKRFKNV
jgi:hypothetical protein